MATTTKKGSQNKKAKPRRPMVNTSLTEQAQTIAELRQELETRNRDLAQSLQRENATASENVRLVQELKESLEQQTSTSQILGVIASSPREIQPVRDQIAANAARLCDWFNAQIYLVEGNTVRKVASHGITPPAFAVGETPPITRGWPPARAILDRQPVHI